MTWGERITRYVDIFLSGAGGTLGVIGVLKLFQWLGWLPFCL